MTQARPGSDYSCVFLCFSSFYEMIASTALIVRTMKLNRIIICLSNKSESTQTEAQIVGAIIQRHHTQ